MFSLQSRTTKFPKLFATAIQPAIMRQFSAVSSENTSTSAAEQESHIGIKTSTKQPKKYYKIKLIRSLIGLNPKTIKNAKALRLDRTGKTMFHPVNATNAGIILKIKELVSVELVDDRTMENLKPEPGYTIVKRFK